MYTVQEKQSHKEPEKINLFVANAGGRVILRRLLFTYILCSSAETLWR
jgi:hypothetical protein